jgi:hypothetical protein
LCHHVSPDPWSASLSPPPCGVGSRASTCPQTHIGFLYLYHLVWWAPVLPRAPGFVASFLLSAPLLGGLPCHHVPPNPQSVDSASEHERSIRLGAMSARYEIRLRPMCPCHFSERSKQVWIIGSKLNVQKYSDGFRRRRPHGNL